MSKSANEHNQVMVVNDIPGEECRIAVLEQGRLEELYSERTASATNVGNIYKGRVVNVEAAIQAAFVDFGSGNNGFLHISDLHPRYFPGEEVTERVGKKIPRRERPPIQQALKRGDAILVQVIKEGIGTKGPTLTSYISIPGRLMVMMPDMDRVGVSRKIEDEEKRREMRQILDSLDLPDGFGFILRTAGFGRTKTDLKRDLAYLNRLWKQMEKRIDHVQAPCALYVESDLLIRTIRDILSPNVSAIVVDSESGYKRAGDFLRVIAPRSAPNVIRYTKPTPIFHAFNIERQIDLIHKREVPLPSGGAIVIEQTEALVAIDVNSGRSRGARDSETNAYRTNCEATDEICRQLRLRDLGGLVCCDLIDMIRVDNRRAIEKRFRDNLARDRARTTVTRISEFGVLELTRQRMRPSMRKSHYQPCSHCTGRGEIRTPESMASEALRYVAYLLQYDRVEAVEMVCSVRVASTLLSGKRRELVELEDLFDKTIRVRVSESIAADRIDYYAYDDRSADVDISKLPSLTPPSLEALEKAEKKEAAKEEAATAGEPMQPGRKKRRRRRGRGAASLEATLQSRETTDELDRLTSEGESDAKKESEAVAANGEAGGEGRKKKRRRRRRKSQQEPASTDAAAAHRDEQQKADEDAEQPAPAAQRDGEARDESAPPAEGEQPKKKKRRRRRRRKGEGGARSEVEGAKEPAAEEPAASASDRDESKEDAQPATSEDGGKRKKRRRRRKKAGTGDERAPSATTGSKDAGSKAPAPLASENGSAESKSSSDGEDAGQISSKSQTKPRRALYRSRRRVAAGAAKDARSTDED